MASFYIQRRIFEKEYFAIDEYMSLNVANTEITFATLTSRTHQRKCMKQKRIVCFRKHDDREIKTAEIYT